LDQYLFGGDPSVVVDMNAVPRVKWLHSWLSAHIRKLYADAAQACARAACCLITHRQWAFASCTKPALSPLVRN
jgi:hypothetical protein